MQQHEESGEHHLLEGKPHGVFVNRSNRRFPGPKATASKSSEAIIERKTERVSLDLPKSKRPPKIRTFKIPLRSFGYLVAVLHTQSHALIQPVSQPREGL